MDSQAFGYRSAAQYQGRAGSYAVTPASQRLTSSACIDTVCRTGARVIAEMVDTWRLGVSRKTLPTYHELASANTAMESFMEHVWAWICGIFDTFEAQLQLGGKVIRELGELELPRGAREQDGSDGRTSRLPHYLLSLLRGHHGEHGDTHPVLDLACCRHVVFLLDACLYYIKYNVRPLASSARRPQRPFFYRSQSTSLDEQARESTFTAPLQAALPLADRPDILQLTSPRRSLFGSESGQIDRAEASVERPRHVTLSLSRRLLGTSKRYPQAASLDIHNVNIEVPPARWSLVFPLLKKLFVTDVVSEPYSVLGQSTDFRAKETWFREAAEALRSGRTSELKFTVPREPRDNFLRTSFKQLEAFISRYA